MTPLADSIAPDGLVLWNVVETHFDELEFAVEQFERRLEDPRLPLSELARYPQPQLDAHTDGLVVGGSEVREKFLLPPLMAANGASSARVTAAALAVIAAGRFDVLWTVLNQASGVVRGAIARAASINPRPELDAWVADKLSRTQSDNALAGLLELAAARGCAPPNVLKLLQSDDAGVIAAACRAARHGDAKLYLPVMLHRLQHADPGVRRAALLATLTWGAREAWEACERAALESSDAFAMSLYAALGGRKHHQRLSGRLAKDPKRAPILFALGFSGDSAMLPVLSAALRAPDTLDIKLAAQSISLITGLDLGATEYLQPRAAARAPGELPPPDADPEALATLPPLEEEDLDADLVPQPEAAIPELNIQAVERHCRTASLDSTRRLLGGAPFGAEVLLDYLEHAQLRRRHVLALALGICTAGSVWFDSRAGSAAQSAQLATLRARGIGSVLRAYKDW